MRESAAGIGDLSGCNAVAAPREGVVGELEGGSDTFLEQIDEDGGIGAVPRQYGGGEQV